MADYVLKTDRSSFLPNDDDFERIRKHNEKLDAARDAAK